MTEQIDRDGLTKYRSECVDRVERALKGGSPSTALRIAMSTTPFATGVASLDLNGLAATADSDVVSDVAELAMWLVQVGNRIEDYIDRHQGLQNEYDKLVAQRSALRQFLGTGQ